MKIMNKTYCRVCKNVRYVIRESSVCGIDNSIVPTVGVCSNFEYKNCRNCKHFGEYYKEDYGSYEIICKHPKEELLEEDENGICTGWDNHD